MQRWVYRVLTTTLFLFATLITGNIYAQDAGQVLRLFVGYRTMVNRIPMDEEKRALVNQLQAKANAANSDKKYGEAIKYLSHGMALMRNQPWTPASELGAALQMKASNVVVDPGDEIDLILSSIFSPDQKLNGKLSGSVTIGRPRNRDGASELKTLSDISPAFDSPLTVKAKVPDLPDGTYELVVTLKPADGDPVVKTAAIQIARGLNSQARALTQKAANVKSEIGKNGRKELLHSLAAVEYPVSMIDLMNKGELPAERTDLRGALSRASERLTLIAKGENPLQTARGDMHWAYHSEVDNSLQPYRMFIPSNYDAKKSWPLVVALHGMGGDENSFFAAYNNGEIKKYAETRGYLVVCPKGRGPTSMYMGSAERDVLDVIAEMKREFSIDDSRVYLTGHSMGGYGTWSISVNHPDLFAAIAPIAGGGNPFVVAKLRGAVHIPQLVIHGDKDPTVPVDESRKMVKAAQELGIKVKYNEIPGGDHSNIVVPGLKDIFDWFDEHRRGTNGSVKAAGSSN